MLNGLAYIGQWALEGVNIRPDLKILFDLLAQNVLVLLREKKNCIRIY